VVGVTGVPISSLVMPKLPDTGSTEARAANRKLTVLKLPSQGPVRRVYHLVTVDQWGRVVARAAMDCLGWQPDTQLRAREQAGLIHFTADPAGTVTVTAHGQLRVPVGLRRWCQLEAGTQILIVADPLVRHLVIHPMPAVDVLVARQHAEIFGGDQ
jgi:hypothetical protein